MTPEGQSPTTVEHRCSASIGVTLFINHVLSQDEIYQAADRAMYQAKKAGGNRVQFFMS